MEENRPQPHAVLAPLLYFALTAIMAIILLVAALIMWLYELLGSAKWATLIVGGGFLFVAWLIYVLAVKRCLDYIRDRLDTVYDVAYSIRNGYKVALQYLGSILGDVLRK